MTRWVALLNEAWDELSRTAPVRREYTEQVSRPETFPL